MRYYLNPMYPDLNTRNIIRGFIELWEFEFFKDLPGLQIRVCL